MHFHYNLLLVVAYGLFTSVIAYSSLSRSSFPPDFIFGAGSSAYQNEGGAKEDGKGPSIWDTLTNKYPEKVIDGSNGNVAADFYHKYKEDIKLMKDMNLDAFRLSFSWSRILPNGTVEGGVNEKGIDYYNNVINELLANGIEPFVTIFHWDLPQTLQDEYGGFLSPRIVDDFREYANICFKYFGDRVKQWTTINEPWVFSVGGYSFGIFPPNRCLLNESLLVSHHEILAHAAATNLYKHRYQATQKGKVGITMLSNWIKGHSSTTSNQKKDLQQKMKTVLDFSLGAFLDPSTKGDYPKSMRRLLGGQLPKFTKEQSKMIKKASFDFVGLNYYGAYLMSPNPPEPDHIEGSCILDFSHFATLVDYEHGQPIFNRNVQSETESNMWMNIYPNHIRDLLRYMNRKYNRPAIYIMENGKEQFYNNKTSVKEALQDSFRIDYFDQHLTWVRKSIKDGINVKGYFVWSFLDGFEWTKGHNIAVGLNYVDYKDGRKRIPKLSSLWFKDFLRRNVSFIDRFHYCH